MPSYTFISPMILQMPGNIFRPERMSRRTLANIRISHALAEKRPVQREQQLLSTSLHVTRVRNVQPHPCSYVLLENRRQIPQV